MARTTKATEAETAAVDPVDALPGATVSAVVPAVLSEAVESHRWSERMSRADVVKQALTEWAEKRNLLDDARARLADKLITE